MKNLIYSKNGFSLVEVLLASSIAAMIIGGIVIVYFMSVSAWNEGSAQFTLQRRGSIAMEKMTRGVDGRNGIREAQEISLPATGATGTQINYVDAVNPAITRSFFISAGDDGDINTPADNQIIYSEAGVDTPVVGSDVRSLSFNHSSDNAVTIELGLQDNVRGKTLNLDLRTTVKMRN